MRLCVRCSLIPDHLQSWRTEPVGLCDGGPDFFGAEYDVEQKKFLYFEFNGLRLIQLNDRDTVSTISNAAAWRKSFPAWSRKSLQRGWRAAIKTDTSERSDALDTLLWTYDDQSFLPHAQLGDGEARGPAGVDHGGSGQSQCGADFLLCRRGAACRLGRIERPGARGAAVRWPRCARRLRLPARRGKRRKAPATTSPIGRKRLPGNSKSRTDLWKCSRPSISRSS